MPTWRNWLDSVSDEAFENSAYFRNYMQLLNSERFSEILEKYDLQIYFYLHAKFQSHLKTFHIASDRINVLSFGHAFLIWLVLMASSMVVSILLEGIKKAVRFERLSGKISDRILDWADKTLWYVSRNGV